jgi:hypothetical protein
MLLVKRMESRVAAIAKGGQRRPDDNPSFRKRRVEYREKTSPLRAIMPKGEAARRRHGRHRCRDRRDREPFWFRLKIERLEEVIPIRAAGVKRFLPVYCFQSCLSCREERPRLNYGHKS